MDNPLHNDFSRKPRIAAPPALALPPEQRHTEQPDLSARAAYQTLNSIKLRSGAALESATVRELVDLGFLDSIPTPAYKELEKRSSQGKEASKALELRERQESACQESQLHAEFKAGSVLYFLGTLSWLGTGASENQSRTASELKETRAVLRKQISDLEALVKSGEQADNSLAGLVPADDVFVSLSKNGEKLLERLQPRSTLLVGQSLEEILLAMNSVDKALQQKVQIALELKEHLEQHGIPSDKPGMLESVFALSAGKKTGEEILAGTGKIELQLAATPCTAEQRFFLASLLLRGEVDATKACHELTASAEIVATQRGAAKAEYLDLYISAMLLGAGDATTVKELFKQGIDRASELLGKKKTGGLYHLAARLAGVPEETWKKCKELSTSLPGAQKENSDWALAALTLAGAPLPIQRIEAIFSRTRDLLLESRLINSENSVPLIAAIAAHPGAVDPRVALLKDLSGELIGIEKNNTRRLALSYILLHGVEEELASDVKGLSLSLVGGVARESSLSTPERGTSRASETNALNNSAQFGSGYYGMPPYICFPIDDGGSSINPAAPCGSSDPGSHGAHCGSGHSHGSHSSDSGAHSAEGGGSPVHSGGSSGSDGGSSAASCGSSSASSCGGGGGSSCGGGGGC